MTSATMSPHIECRCCKKQHDCSVCVPELCNRCGESMRAGRLDDTMRTSKCRYCGRSVIWAVDANGKKQCLDAVTPIYQLVDGGDPPSCDRAAAFALHQGTCRQFQEMKKSGTLPAPKRCSTCGGAQRVFDPNSGYRIDCPACVR